MAATTGQQMQKSSREAAFLWAAFHARFLKSELLALDGQCFQYEKNGKSR
ncbi:hypothetical protein [Comamonas jiangduensis]|uniref:Transposase n=1 Tax=Comamonas jiangduensis TaxID=1194168 RepID=A0ABV4IE23_9BURK